MDIDRRYTQLGEFRIHSLHTGRGAPVVLLHGLSGSHRWWRLALPPLAEHFRVHIPELVGFGGSRPAARQPSIPEMAGVLAGWLDALELERPHVVGHSMGGQISIHVAARRPERVDRLVLANAAGIPRDFSLPELARLLAELMPPRAWGAPEFLPTIAFDALRAGPRVLWSAARHLLQDDVRPLLPSIVAPTLLIWGELDPLIPLEHARLFQEQIPNARLLILPDAAHTPMADRSRDFAEAVIAFLRE